MGQWLHHTEGLQGSSKLPEEQQEKIDEALQQDQDYYIPMRGKFFSCYP